MKEIRNAVVYDYEGSVVIVTREGKNITFQSFNDSNLKSFFVMTDEQFTQLYAEANKL